MSLLSQAPGKPAVIMAGSGATLSYRELVDGMNRLARVLRSQCEVGDRVAMLMDNEPDYLTVAWGVRRAGLRGVPVNWHLTAAEVAYMVDNSDAVALIVSAGLIDVAEEVRGSNDRLRICLTNGAETAAFASLRGVMAASSPEPLDDTTEGNLMFYSSGTTGWPKAIKRPLPEAPFGTHSNWELLMQGQYGVTEDTVLLIGAAVPHRPDGVVPRLSGHRRHGGPAGAFRRRDRSGGHRTLRRHPRALRAHPFRAHVASARGGAGEVRRVVAPPGGPRGRAVSAAREAGHDRVVRADHRRVLLGHRGGGLHRRRQRDLGAQAGHRRASLGGIPHILDEEGRELPVGETGAVYFEGVDAFEYHGDPGKTNDFFNARGWGCNGDMGWLDEDGYLFLADRRSHMIISGGVNIYPQESENVLFEHPAVADVAVIGVPNDEFGEEVKAVVELRPEAGPGNDELAEELQAFCRSKLAHYKCPRSIDFVEELPRTPTGKVRKSDIRQAYWGEGRRQQIV